MRDKNSIWKVVEKVLEGSSFYVVDIHVNAAGLIQIFIDHPEAVSLDDCGKWHRSIEEHLDREEEDYELQVHSAGLDQPLKDPRQYFKRIGQILKISTIEGKQLRGTLTDVKKGELSSDAIITIIPIKTKKNTNPDPVELRLSEIRVAKIELKF